MSAARSRTALLKRLDAGEVVPLSAANWEAWQDAFEIVESVHTSLAGDIIVVRRGKDRKWGVVEEPAPGHRVVRPLPDEATVRALIAERLAAYERMWDG